MRGAQPGEPITFHGTGKPLADSGAADVDELAGYEMIDGDLGAHLLQVVGADPEFPEPSLGFDLGFGEVAAHCLGHVLHLGGADAHLHGAVTILFDRALGHHLAIFHLQHGDRNVVPVFREQTGHAKFTRDQSGTHDAALSRS